MGVMGMMWRVLVGVRWGRDLGGFGGERGSGRKGREGWGAVENRRMKGLGKVDVERRWRGIEWGAWVLLELSTAPFCVKVEVGLFQDCVVVFRDDKTLAGGSSKWAWRVSISLIHYTYIFISNRHIFTSSLHNPPKEK